MSMLFHAQFVHCGFPSNFYSEHDFQVCKEKFSNFVSIVHVLYLNVRLLGNFYFKKQFFILIGSLISDEPNREKRAG